MRKIINLLLLMNGRDALLAAVNFLEGETGEGLQAKLRQAAEQLACEELVFCTDIAGGTPFNQSVLLSSQLKGKCLVFSGTNMPFLLQALFDREDALDELEGRWLSGPVQVVPYHAGKKVRHVQEGGI